MTWLSPNNARTMKLGSLLAIALVLAGCSNKQLYSTIRENRRAECNKLPQSQVEKCMSEHDALYDEYRRERQSVIDSESVE